MAYVFKRNGRKERVAFDKITSRCAASALFSTKYFDACVLTFLCDRISKLCWGLNTDHVDVIEVSKKVIAGVYNGVTTVELDQLAAEACCGAIHASTRKVGWYRLTPLV